MSTHLKVLCVDDEHINLLILERILGKKYEIITAESGPSALEILERNPEIKLIISDMRMPEMSGLEFISEAQSKFADKKYFLLSGFDLNDEIQAALDAKLICGYFQKPPDFKAIDQALQDHS